jgi:hypothetical protein
MKDRAAADHLKQFPDCKNPHRHYDNLSDNEFVKIMQAQDEEDRKAALASKSENDQQESIQDIPGRNATAKEPREKRKVKNVSSVPNDMILLLLNLNEGQFV